MSRRADRRRYAILGVLAENGPMLARDVATRLRCNVVDVVNVLPLLEKQGRVVSERTLTPPGAPPTRFYRLPYEWERKPQDGT